MTLEIAEHTRGEGNAVEVKQGRRAGTGMVHGHLKSQSSRYKKAAELLQQLSGPPRFGKHSLI